MAKSPLDALVKTEGNRTVIDRVIAVTQTHDAPQKLFVVGPEDSGKTLLFRARAMEKDLLSTKRVSYRTAQEMVDAVLANAWDGFFEEIGSFEVLFIDDFEGILSKGDVGPMLFKLMMQERDQHKLDTIVASKVPLAELEQPSFEGTLDEFEQLVLAPLDEVGMVAFAEELIDAYGVEGKSPTLSQEAIDFIARDYAKKPSDVRRAICRFMEGEGFESQEVLDLDRVKAALA